MSLIEGFLLVILVMVFGMWKSKKRRTPPHWGGYVHPSFEKLKDIFIDNLEKSWERDGAAVCVYYKGQCVVDLWGGVADKEKKREYTEDTLQIVFSTSKALGAVCIAKLVDQGRLKYSDRISSFWPGFAKHGKELITMEMVLSHTAGLAHLSKEITWEDASNPEMMAKILEEQVPNWEPGKNIGYHAFSFGWLVDQIIRHVDGRGVGQFWREEIAEKFDLSVYIGLPREETARVARISRPTMWNRFDEFLTDRSNVNYMFIAKQYVTRGLAHKVAHNPPWLQTIFNMHVNNPELYPLEQPAVLAISNARDMARLAQLLQSGQVVSKEVLDQMEEIISYGKDLVSGTTTRRGRGVTIVEYKQNGINSRLVGHAGLGGQNLRWDRETDLAFCYLSNGLKGGLGDRARSYVRVLDAMWECLPANNNDLLNCPSA